MDQSRSIAQMAPGDTAIIAGFLSDDFSNKFLEMGFLPGVAVRLNFRAPMGDPICVSIAGYELTLRLDEAASISILN
ncbi:MAG: FeoA family protein [Cyclobacteriaceae bacterium]